MTGRLLLLFAVVALAVGALSAAFASAGQSSDPAPEELTEAESAALNTLAEAGPNDIRCIGSGEVLTCAGVPGEEALSALRNGEELYGRHVYGDVSRVADTGIPFFEADELLCGEAAQDGTLSCSPAGAVQPTVERDQTMLATYRRYHVTFNSEGGTVARHGERVVPLILVQG
jgi:hypothetical protein